MGTLVDVIFIIIFLALALWAIASYFGKSRNRASHITNPRDPILQKTPFEKMLDQHTLDWQIRLKKKELKKQEAKLAEALTKGDRISAKVHKSMLTFSKSVISYLEKQIH